MAGYANEADGPAQAPASLRAPLAIPAVARETVGHLLDGGWLHRYSEAGASMPPAAARLEVAMSALVGRNYAVAVNSCGSALFLALKAAGVRDEEPVLVNAFTLGPVPGAVVHAAGVPVVVGVTEDLVIDLDDLAVQQRRTGARFLLLSHMRGHIADMDALMEQAESLGLQVIEDCAHTMGAAWGDRASGSFGLASCFSFQSGKHANAGEGGVLVTDDPDLAARAILHSGSYMLYAQNGAAPAPEIIARHVAECANFSLRMPEIAAELALAQLPLLAERAARWNRAHDRLARALGALPGVALPQRPQAEAYVQSSIQFRLPEASDAAIAAFVGRCRERRLWLKWFGAAEPEGYTSRPAHWPCHAQAVNARTNEVLRSLLDLRLSDRLSDDDVDLIARIIADSLTQ